MRFEDKHKALSKGEQKLLLTNTLVSGIMLGAVAAIIAFFLVMVQQGASLFDSLISFGWLSFFADGMLPDDLLTTGWWGFLVGPGVLLAVYCCLDLELSKNLKSYDADILEIRQGLTGELIALDGKKLYPAMLFTNFFEELLFRGTLIPLFLAILGVFGLVSTPAALIASVVSALAFWFVHGQYRNKYSIITTVTLGIVLAWIYLWWGSVLVCLLAHFLYNVYVTSRERRLAVELDDYYGGEQPRTILTDMTTVK
ncbi:MAG: CPBP family intramembrane metalloprotease [Eggerthellales bacterium]|nr:CPBP family intramembrane metalloprotease [Eggerthellales bacterium]